MDFEQKIRETVSNKVFEKTSKKVRNVAFLCRDLENQEYYLVWGNNNKLIAVVRFNGVSCWNATEDDFDIIF